MSGLPVCVSECGMISHCIVIDPLGHYEMLTFAQGEGRGELKDAALGLC